MKECYNIRCPYYIHIRLVQESKFTKKEEEEEAVTTTTTQQGQYCPFITRMINSESALLS
ncbi:hypothetical protein DERF_003403 [Dermatophagoides farinae]|uniref:Uncharacterized protein n=1 Tax=Dermatophagoides farinae TaxID=6954 RepID=A0A922LBG8_DERFA|nr:hypothetical protein DERF_003403 [Dermatophagoides farinae]